MEIVCTPIIRCRFWRKSRRQSLQPHTNTTKSVISVTFPYTMLWSSADPVHVLVDLRNSLARSRLQQQSRCKPANLGLSGGRSQCSPVDGSLELLDDDCEDSASFPASDSYENTLAPTLCMMVVPTCCQNRCHYIYIYIYTHLRLIQIYHLYAIHDENGRLLFVSIHHY